jgi:hypothetical protein
MEEFHLKLRSWQGKGALFKLIGEKKGQQIYLSPLDDL